MYGRGISYKSAASEVTSLEGTGAGQLAPAPIQPVRSYYSTIDQAASGIKAADTTLLGTSPTHLLYTSFKFKRVNSNGATVWIPYSDIYNGVYQTQIDAIADNWLAINKPGHRYTFQHEINANIARDGSGSNDVDALKAYIYCHDRFEARRVAAGKAAGYFVYYICYAGFGIGTTHGDNPPSLVGGLGDAGTLFPDYGVVNRPDTVDEIGYDPYNFAGLKGTSGVFDTNTWRELSWLAQVALDFGVLKGKPVCFPEWNGNEDPNNVHRKGVWITNAHAWMKANSGTTAGKITNAMYYNDALYATTQSFKVANANPDTLAALKVAFSDVGVTRTPNAPGSAPNTALGVGTVTLNWTIPTQYTNGDALTSIQGYKLYQDGSSTAYAAMRPPDATSYKLTGFAAGSTHTWQISTVDGNGVESSKTSLPSVTFPTSTDTTAPSVPNLASTALHAITPNQVNIDIPSVTDAGSGVNRIDVYRAAGATTTGRALIGAAGPTDTSYSDNTVLPGTQYTYDLVAVDNAGNASGHGTFRTITTPAAVDTTPPGRPGSLQGVPSVAGDSATFTWTAATDDVGVTLYTLLMAPLGLPLIEVADTTNLTINVTGLSPGQAYQWDVVAKDVVGNTSLRAGTPLVIQMPSVGGPIITSVTTSLITGSDLARALVIAATPSGAGPLQVTITSWGEGAMSPAIFPVSQLTIPHSWGDFGRYRVVGTVQDLSNSISTPFSALVDILDPSGSKTVFMSYWKPTHGIDIAASDWQAVLDAIDGDVGLLSGHLAESSGRELGPAGEVTSMNRERLASGANMVSGKTRVKFFKTYRDLHISQLRSKITTPITAGDTTTIWKLCVCILNVTADTAKVVALTTNDTALPLAGGAFTKQLTSISASQQDADGLLYLPAGTIVGFGALWVGTFTGGHVQMPVLLGSGGGGDTEHNASPRLAGVILSQTDLPALDANLSGWSTTDTPPSHVYIAGS